MDSRRPNPNGFREAEEIRKLLKLKDSKVGNVILKENVLEQAKLDNKLDLISHHQRSREVNLSWKKQLLLRKQRNTLIKSKSTSAIMIPPSHLPRLLPPIQIKPTTTTFSQQQIDAGMTEHEEDVLSKIPTLDTLGRANVSTDSTGPQERNLECFSTKSSEKAFLQWKRAIKQTREQIRKSKMKLPPLMLEKTRLLDYEKDPRFSRLIEQLVPNINRRNSDGNAFPKIDAVDDEEITDVEHEDEDIEEEPNY